MTWVVKDATSRFDVIDVTGEVMLAADHDGVVVPSHSYKYVATLQATAGRANPVLLRVATRSGHADSSALKTAERLSDAYAFLFQYPGVAYRAPMMPAAAQASLPAAGK